MIINVNNLGYKAQPHIIPTVIYDYDGNEYTYVTIGTQQWLVENLRTTHYVDGTLIPNLTDDDDWIVEDGTPGHNGAYCWYDNNINYKDSYGALYNWYAVDNAHGLAPAGWRVPSITDFDTLIAFLGGSTIAGGKLKEMGLSHWNTPNTGATNEYGFSLLGAGHRSNNTGYFQKVKDEADCWSTVESSSTIAFGKFAYYNQSYFNVNTADKRWGWSVRCLRDV